MASRFSFSWGVGLFLLVAVSFLLGSVFVVQEIEQVLVLQFGQIKRIVNVTNDPQPGLHFKIPFIQNVIYYDKRLLDYDLTSFEVTCGDQKRLVVDIFTRYKILDPLKFYKTVNTEAGAQKRLGALIPGLLRSVIGSFPLTSMLSSERSKIMHNIRDQVNGAVAGLGIQVVDFRIRRADLPRKNGKAIFDRMISDREKEAKEFRAKGAEAAQFIRAQADKESLLILAEAKKKAQILRGEGDGKAAQIYAQIHGKDPEFYEFYQSMNLYKNSFSQKENAVFILSPESSLFKYLGGNSQRGS